MIALSLSSWMSVRFSLTTAQMTYLGSLPPAFIQLLQDELVEAINYHLPIRLEKEVRPFAADPEGGDSEGEDSVKVTEINKKRSAGASYRTTSADTAPTSSGSDGEDALIIHIFYRDA